jgi:hypothetical protein
MQHALPYPALILRRAAVSKDVGDPWFETRCFAALLTMRLVDVR